MLGDGVQERVLSSVGSGVVWRVRRHRTAFGATGDEGHGRNGRLAHGWEESIPSHLACKPLVIVGRAVAVDSAVADV